MTRTDDAQLVADLEPAGVEPAGVVVDRLVGAVSHEDFGTWQEVAQVTRTVARPRQVHGVVDASDESRSEMALAASQAQLSALPPRHSTTSGIGSTYGIPINTYRNE